MNGTHVNRDLWSVISRSAFAAFSTAVRWNDVRRSWSYESVRSFVLSSSVRDMSCCKHHRMHVSEVTVRHKTWTHDTLCQHPEETFDDLF